MWERSTNPIAVAYGGIGGIGVVLLLVAMGIPVVVVKMSLARSGWDASCCGVSCGFSAHSVQWYLAMGPDRTDQNVQDTKVSEKLVCVSGRLVYVA